MDRHIQVMGDGIAVKLVAIGDKEATLAVSVTKHGEPLIFWTVEHLKEQDSWNLSGCDLRVPCELTD